MTTEYYLGIDIGSTASKCVIVDQNGEIASKGLHSSGAGTQGPALAMQGAFDELGIDLDDITASCATGYGRKLVDWTGNRVSELSCHAKGAGKLFPGVKTVIDIGGQDAKVLHIDNGHLEAFVMNDKCAAGTGRFLNVMASIFGCDVGDLSDLDKQSTKVAPVSSTCTVFAESEVVSKLAAGEAIPDVVAGVHMSVVTRTAGLVRRLGVVPNVAMTGGVALNESLRNRLAAEIGHDIVTSPLSQFNGALGAALFALEKADGR